MYHDAAKRLKIKQHTRHYYLGEAARYMRLGDEKEVQLNLKVVERFQKEIEDLEAYIAADKGPVLTRMW